MYRIAGFGTATFARLISGPMPSYSKRCAEVVERF
jgi:hypothetical protein